jgi:hypothetical protein
MTARGKPERPIFFRSRSIPAMSSTAGYQIEHSSGLLCPDLKRGVSCSRWQRCCPAALLCHDFTPRAATCTALRLPDDEHQTMVAAFSALVHDIKEYQSILGPR